MKTLFILRHAKSSWEDANLADFDRPLNKRGLKTAPLVGETIRRNKFQIDSIISSPAKRAKQTAILVKEAAQIAADILFDDQIYEASPHRLLHVASELDDKIESAMLVGHNPGLEGLVTMLTRKAELMPTATLAVVDLKIDNWKEIHLDCCNLRVLIRPKD
ncbi:MAG TPA: histidine phosphatase family protein [Pyrinomonadaceae bacterium]|nr:histidine phosphatase family protein [Pyrinomonadaceae bacterium]